MRALGLPSGEFFFCVRAFPKLFVSLLLLKFSLNVYSLISLFLVDFLLLGGELNFDASLNMSGHCGKKPSHEKDKFGIERCAIQV